MSESQRVDKWLWVARFFKSRSLAKEAVELGRVLVNGERVKAAKEVQIGDRLRVTRETEVFDVTVKGFSETRLGAKFLDRLYEEDEQSKNRREAAKEAKRLFQEPATTRQTKGRPVKKEIREIRKFRGY